MSQKKILGLSGSLRNGAFTTTLLDHLAQHMPAHAQMHIHPLGDVPLYNQDLDTDTPPPAVAALREAIGAADGLVIISPEYNYGMSGVLKNALDWASRPYGKSVLIGKPVITMSASPAFTGGVRAQAQLHETLLAIPMQIIARPQTVVGEVHKKIVDGKLIDGNTASFIETALADLLAALGN